MEDFVNASNVSHAENYRKQANTDRWLNDDSADSWRHYQKLAIIDPLLKAYPGSRWLTIGDGRYGMEARYILKKGAYAMATDICDELLAEAHDKGYLGDYKCENAEALSFGDGSFDFVLCKESYHHFPRPMLALYEMLRVCGKGVVLIEPSDSLVDCTIWQKLKHKIVGVSPGTGDYEEVGNYVYTLSRREMIKVALGMNYKAVSFKGLFDYYLEGADKAKTDNNYHFNKIKSEMKRQERLTKLGLAYPGILGAVIFKTSPSDSCLDLLRDDGFDTIKLSSNPHINVR